MQSRRQVLRINKSITLWSITILLIFLTDCRQSMWHVNGLYINNLIFLAFIMHDAFPAFEEVEEF